MRPWDSLPRAAFGYAIVAFGRLGFPIGPYRTCRRVFFVMTVVTNLLATGESSIALSSRPSRSWSHLAPTAPPRTHLIPHPGPTPLRARVPPGGLRAAHRALARHGLYPPDRSHLHDRVRLVHDHAVREPDGVRALPLHVPVHRGTSSHSFPSLLRGTSADEHLPVHLPHSLSSSHSR